MSINDIDKFLTEAERLQRDQFLTESLGECWHECTDHCTDFCNINNDFSTWEGFGKLWEWSQKQKWWRGSNNPVWCGFTSYRTQGLINIGEAYINPDRFAVAVYIYLKESECVALPAIRE